MHDSTASCCSGHPDPPDRPRGFSETLVSAASYTSLKVEQPADLVANPSIPWKLEGSCPQVFECVVIFSVRLLDQRVEVVHLRSVRTVGGQPFLEGHRLFKHLFSPFHIALLNATPCDVDPAVHIARLNLRDFQEHRFRTFEIALKE